jgi:hypothetical protein
MSRPAKTDDGILGLLTRAAAIPLIIGMLAAIETTKIPLSRPKVELAAELPDR